MMPAFEIDLFIVVETSLTVGVSTDVKAGGTPTKVLEDVVLSTSEIGRLVV